VFLQAEMVAFAVSAGRDYGPHTKLLLQCP